MSFLTRHAGRFTMLGKKEETGTMDRELAIFYLIIAPTHRLNGLAIGNFLGVGSSGSATFLLLLVLAVATLTSFLVGSVRRLAFALQIFGHRLMLRQKRIGSVVSRYQPSVKKFVEIPSTRIRKTKINDSTGTSKTFIPYL